MMTAEQRKAAAAKAAATLKARKEAERERFRAVLRDQEIALEVCRSIRDDVTASDADRLEAIRMISVITGHE